MPIPAIMRAPIISLFGHGEALEGMLLKVPRPAAGRQVDALLPRLIEAL